MPRKGALKPEGIRSNFMREYEMKPTTRMAIRIMVTVTGLLIENRGNMRSVIFGSVIFLSIY